MGNLLQASFFFSAVSAHQDQKIYREDDQSVPFTKQIYRRQKSLQTSYKSLEWTHTRTCTHKADKSVTTACSAEGLWVYSHRQSGALARAVNTLLISATFFWESCCPRNNVPASRVSSKAYQWLNTSSSRMLYVSQNAKHLCSSCQSSLLCPTTDKVGWKNRQEYFYDNLSTSI